MQFNSESIRHQVNSALESIVSLAGTGIILVKTKLNLELIS